MPLQQVSFDYNGFRALTAEGGTKGVMSSLGFHPVIVERPRNKLEVRPPHQPSEASRRQVRALAAYGIPQDEIARVVGLSKPTLEKHYRPELDRAETETNAKVDEQACSLGLIPSPIDQNPWAQSRRPMDQTCPALKTLTESRPQGLGMRRLRAYRKEWDSHGADSFLTFACSNYTPPSALPTRKRGMSWVV